MAASLGFVPSRGIRAWPWDSGLAVGFGPGRALHSFALGCYAASTKALTPKRRVSITHFIQPGARCV